MNDSATVYKTEQSTGIFRPCEMEINGANN